MFAQTAESLIELIKSLVPKGWGVALILVSPDDEQAAVLGNLDPEEVVSISLAQAESLAMREEGVSNATH